MAYNHPNAFPFWDFVQSMDTNTPTPPPPPGAPQAGAHPHPPPPYGPGPQAFAFGPAGFYGFGAAGFPFGGRGGFGEGRGGFGGFGEGRGGFGEGRGGFGGRGGHGHGPGRRGRHCRRGEEGEAFCPSGDERDRDGDKSGEDNEHTPGEPGFGHGHHGHHGRGGRRGGPFGRRGGFGGWNPREGAEGAPFDLSALLEHFSAHPFAQAIKSYIDQASGVVDNTEGVADSFVPAIDLFSTETQYILHVALPGAKKEDVGVNWDAEKGVLNVAGVVYRAGDEEFLKTLSKGERKVGVFDRAIKLPPTTASAEEQKEEVDGENITAKLEDGVLVVTVPKVEREWTEVKKVDIE